MKIDLEKELGLNQASQPDKFPWMKVIIFLCSANFLLLLIILFNSKPNHSSIINENSFIEMNSQFIANVSARLTNIEQLQKQLRISQKKSKKALSIAASDKKLEEKRRRMNQKKIEKIRLE